MVTLAGKNTILTKTTDFLSTICSITKKDRFNVQLI